MERASMNKKLRAQLAPCMVLAAWLGACASAPKPVAPPQATVSNLTGKPVSIRYQRCGGPAEPWLPLDHPALASGAMTRFVPPADCVNFDAFYPDGRLAGSQRSIRNEFPFEWVLR
jgi:hypothetical protein